MFPRQIYFCNLAVDRPEWLGGLQALPRSKDRLATNKTSLRRQIFEPPESTSTPSSNELHLPPAEKRRPSDPAKAFCQMPKVMKTEYPSPPTLLGEPPTSLGSARLYSFHTLGFKGS
ncbi:hypothetical protein TWF103_010265 [Orbilia oligospora]|uniref:Uncharacterized protein n=1 Tax=Orbilia oligospora TaxID=2813651 RepID=A0A7C8NWU9_ORBOL|nr:hypothetical protein TWF103_010265 [Orbilia oligospora]KAF3138148.1 hypothetical protein TWF703_004675 [Orbilia oligospora]